MAVFTVTHAMRLDDYAVVQTLEATEIGIGQSITIAGSTGFNGTFTIRVLGAPPGNQDTADWLLTTIDTLMADQGLAVVAGQPSLAIIGSQELPAYDLTVRIASRRN